MSLARDGLGGFLRGWGEARGNNREEQDRRVLLEELRGGADNPAEAPPPPAGRPWRDMLQMRFDPPRPQQLFVYGGEPPAPELPDAPEYRPEFTHPKGFIKPGFSGDFERRVEPEIIDLDGYDASRARKGKGKAKAVTPPPPKPFKLVCASCKSGLKVNGEDGERVYGLRCGHVLDGACVARMAFPLDMSPLPPPPIDEETKGKEKAMYEELNVQNVDQDQQHQEEEGTATRGRSRVARGRGRGRRGRGRGRGRGGKGRVNATVNATPQFEHLEWRCPVAGCERIHISVRAVITGAPWKHDALRGAVGMFV